MKNFTGMVNLADWVKKGQHTSLSVVQRAIIESHYHEKVAVIIAPSNYILDSKRNICTWTKKGWSNMVSQPVYKIFLFPLNPSLHVALSSKSCQSCRANFHLSNFPNSLSSSPIGCTKRRSAWCLVLGLFSWEEAIMRRLQLIRSWRSVWCVFHNCGPTCVIRKSQNVGLRRLFVTLPGAGCIWTDPIISSTDFYSWVFSVHSVSIALFLKNSPSLPVMKNSLLVTKKSLLP